MKRNINTTIITISLGILFIASFAYEGSITGEFFHGGIVDRIFGGDDKPEETTTPPPIPTPEPDKPSEPAKPDSTKPSGEPTTPAEPEEKLTEHAELTTKLQQFCEKCTFNLAEGVKEDAAKKIEIIESEIRIKEGDKIVKTIKLQKEQKMAFPPNSKFILQPENKIKINLPKDKESLDKLDWDMFNELLKSGEIDELVFDTPTTIGGQHTFEGKFLVKDGQLYSFPGSIANVDHVKISSENKAVRVAFLDDVSNIQDKDFVSLGPNKLTAQGDDFSVELKRDNSYISIDADTDLLKLSPQNNGRIEMTKNFKVISDTTVTCPSGKCGAEWATINNGKYETVLGEKGVVKNKISELFKDKTSVPLSVRVKDNSGKDLIVDKNGIGHKLIYDNNNKQSIIPEDIGVKADGLFTCPEKPV